MTEKENNSFGVIRSCAAGVSSFRMEGERCSRGMRIRLAGILGISEFSEDYVAITNHGGRIGIKGKRLEITVFDNNQIEISGRIEELCFYYGKN